VGGKLELLEAEGEDAARWSAALAPMSGADVYFTPAWTKLFADLDGDRGACAVFESGRGRVLFPLQIRALDRLPFRDSRVLGPLAKARAFDASSPYGYSGPLAAPAGDSDAPALVAEFLEALLARFREERIVSLFIRFHPLLGNAAAFPQAFLDAEKRSETVFLDLSGAWYKSLSSACRYEVRKSEKRGVEVAHASSEEDWRAFGGLYRETMARRNARSWYLFQDDFLKATRERLGPAVTLLTARLDGRMVGGSIFLEGFRRGHYHLSGADTAAAGQGVTNRLVVEGARMLEARGCGVLHLGGGLRPGDGLERFKRSFSPLRAVWDKASVIVDPEAYDALVRARREYLLERGHENADEAGGAFPAYRRGIEIGG
jgi:hypothetical protein